MTKDSSESELDKVLGQFRSRNRRRSASPRNPASHLERRNNRQLFFSLAIIAGLAAVVITASWPYLGPGPASRPIDRLSAAIIDELSLTDPDPAFVSNVTSTLADSGYHVEYYSSNQATVNFYQNLPTLGYGLLILRTHSGPKEIITGQPYSKSQYVWPQLTGSLAEDRISNNQGYFGVTAGFIDNQMRGSFQGATIIVLGCESLQSSDLAAAFIHKGAGAYIGWNNVVTVQYMDMSAVRLVRLISQRRSVESAVQTVAAEDPVYHSRLVLADSSSLAVNQLSDTLRVLSQLAMAILPLAAMLIVFGLVVRRLWRL